MALECLCFAVSGKIYRAWALSLILERSVRLHAMTATGRVWNCARKHQLPAELVLLAAVIAMAVQDAKRGDVEALRWLHGQGF